MKYLSSTGALAIALSATAAGAQVAPAQSAANPPAASQQEAEGAADESGPDAGTGEVVVTAQRREQRLQDVPIAVAAVSGVELQDAHLTTISELTYLAPSLNVVSAQGQVKPFLRGIGTQGALAGIEMPVALYQDGVYISAPNYPVLGFTDIAQVEVIKGPQGTLFGRNATGGLISITSRDPRDLFELSAAASVGTYQTYDANMFVGGGLGDGVRASLYGRYGAQKDGFGTERSTGRGTYKIDHDINLRGKVIVEPGPNTKIKLVGDYVDRDSAQNELRFIGQRSVLVTQPLASAWDTDSNFTPFNRSRGGGGVMQVDQDFGDAGLTSITSYRNSRFHYGVDLDFSPIQALSAEPLQKDRQFTQELQLHSKGSRTLDWIVGGFYFKADADLHHVTLFGGPLAPLATSAVRRDIVSTTSTKSYAMFGQLDWHVTDRTTVTGGLRYTIENRGFVADQTITLKNGVLVPAAFRPADIDYKKFTWRASVDHRFLDGLHGYASYNRGFKSGGYNPTVPADPSYLPEKVDAYEIGFKGNAARHALRFEAAAFYYDYGNMQVSSFQNGVSSIYNGASARLWGVEGSVNYNIGRHFTLSTDASYLDTKFTNFPNGVRGTLLPSGGYLQSGGQDLSGNRTPNAPKFTLSVGGDVHLDTSLGAVKFTAGWYYNDGFFTEADNVLRQDSYHMINLSAQLNPAGTPAYVRVWAKNILSAEVTTQYNLGPLGAGAGFQPPATVGITLGVNL